MRLVLASASPRRRALLAELGLPFDVVPSAVDEAVPPDLSGGMAATYLALAKARAVAAQVGAAVVLGADTLVVVDGRPLGKPTSREEAGTMLAALRGRSHEVVTAVALVEAPSGREASATVRSRVVMRRFTRAELAAYLRTDEPYDKAGAYAVQGRGGRLVARVEGCYTNVVGLPVRTTARVLRTFGFPAIEPSRGLRGREAPGRARPGPRRRRPAGRDRAGGSPARRARGSPRGGYGGSR